MSWLPKMSKAAIRCGMIFQAVFQCTNCELKSELAYGRLRWINDFAISQNSRLSAFTNLCLCSYTAHFPCSASFYSPLFTRRRQPPTWGSWKTVLISGLRQHAQNLLVSSSKLHELPLITNKATKRKMSGPPKRPNTRIRLISLRGPALQLRENPPFLLLLQHPLVSKYHSLVDITRVHRKLALLLQFCKMRQLRLVAR